MQVRRGGSMVSSGRTAAVNHVDPHDVRTTNARQWFGHTLGYDIVQQAIEIKRHVGYMTQRFGLYDVKFAGKISVSSPYLRDAANPPATSAGTRLG